MEKRGSALALYIYGGADADFTLYQDDGFTFEYERGAYAGIPLYWNDLTHMLTTGDCGIADP